MVNGHGSYTMTSGCKLVLCCTYSEIDEDLLGEELLLILILWHWGHI